MDKTKKTIFASIKAITLLSLFMSLSFAQQMTKDQYEQKVRQWHQSSGGQIAYDTFQKGVTWFLTKCASGNCGPCLLSISQEVDGTTSKTWIGGFSGGNPVTLTNTLTAMNDGANGHSRTPTTANKYGTCIRGNSKITCNGGSCRVGGGLHNYELSAATVQELERHLGETPTALIMYGVVIQGQIMFHDGYQCYGQYKKGNSCHPTWGCLTQYPKQMKQLCQEYINPMGGINIYIDKNNSNAGNWASAAKAIEQNKICNMSTRSTLTTYTPASGSSMSGAVESRRYRRVADGNLGSDYSPPNNFNGGSSNLTGNEAFRNCQATSTTDYETQVQATKTGEKITARNELAKEANNIVPVGGGGDQNARAAGLNENNKNCIALASLDDRSKEFTSSNSSENPITKFFSAFFSLFKPSQPTPDLEYRSSN
jgi:hypothetical protein